MAIEQLVEHEVAKVTVGDDYRIEWTLTNPHTGTTVTVALDWTQSEQLVVEALDALIEAGRALREDRPATAAHGFDVDAPVLCKDCSEGGKHGACIGSAYAEVGGEIVEVACGCTADGHRGRS